MKTLKFLSLFFVLSVLGLTSSFAQATATKLTDQQKEELAENMEEFVAVLNLSEEQKPEFKSITKKYAEQMKAVKESGGGKYKMYKKVKAIRKNKNAEMKKLLSQEQYATYIEQQKEMQKKMKEKRR